MPEELNDDSVVIVPYENLALMITKLLSHYLSSITTIDNAMVEIGVGIDVYFQEEVDRFKKVFEKNFNRDELKFEIEYPEFDKFSTESIRNYLDKVVHHMAMIGELEMGIDADGDVTYWNKGDK